MNIKGLDSKKWVRIMTIDIGEKNLALLIEDYPLETIKGLTEKNIVYNARYDKNNECSQKFKKNIDILAKSGEVVWFDKKDLTSKDDRKWGKKRIIDCKFLCRLTNYLEDLNQNRILDGVQYFVIEQQRKQAANNLEIQHHIRAYLVMLFLNFRVIICYPASIKTTFLGMPKKVIDEKSGMLTKTSGSKGKPFRKKWSSKYFLDILEMRGDNDNIEKIFNTKKRAKTDDTSDCGLMSLSFVYTHFVDKKEYET